MITVALFAVFAAGAAGLLIKWIQDNRPVSACITWREFTIGMAVAAFAIAPFVSWIGWLIARNNQLTFTEYWNGWEVTAVKTQIDCTMDGPCYWEYDCDPYQCNPHDCMCDSEGKNCSTCYDTCYHDCPYVTKEFVYTVNSTIGEFTIASYVFPENPDSHRWRRSTRVPESVIARAGVGDPPFWIAARNRCNANTPGPVTKRNNYTNYILASDHSIMRSYSGDIDSYQKASLLPKFQNGIVAFYHADKVHFVGFRPRDAPLWQNALEHFNAALGSTLQGDVQLVLVKNETIAANPERYILALKAYWLDTKTLEHNTLAKNGIIAVIGTSDEKTVAWSRAFTGMPIGNEKMLVVLRDGLKGVLLTPEAILGPAASIRKGGNIFYPPEGVQAGALMKVIWGLDDPSTKFKRVSMSGKDGSAGFLYLKNEVQLTTGQHWAIFIVTFIVCCLVWVWASIHVDLSENSRY